MNGNYPKCPTCGRPYIVIKNGDKVTYRCQPCRTDKKK